MRTVRVGVRGVSNEKPDVGRGAMEAEDEGNDEEVAMGFEDAGGAEGAGGGEAVGRPAEDDDVVEMLVATLAEADAASEGEGEMVRAAAPSEESTEDAATGSVMAMLSVSATASALPVGDTDPPYAQPSPRGIDGP
jgi:hypothetical protein